MKTLRLAMALPLIAWLAVGCDSKSAAEQGEGAPSAEAEEEEDEDEPIAIEEVPQAAIDAALAAVPGLVIEEAELESEGVFELEGHVNGVPTEVEVDAEGNVIEIDSGDDEEDEDGDEGHEAHEEH